LGQRYQALEAELAAVDAELDRLTAQAAPGLRQRFGVGAEIAGALLVAAGENPGRLRSEAAFAMLCGASPVQASSGKTVRHRLNRVAIVRPTRRCTGLWWSACVDISQPVTTWPDGPVKGCRSGRSSGASLDEYPGHDPRGVGL
jgi:Transposase IS116/IS110/IS902 family